MAKTWKQYNSTLTRKVEFKRRGFKKKRIDDAIQKPWKKTPFKKVSRSKRKKLGKYFPTQKQFLKKPENRWCVIAVCVTTDSHINLIKPILALDSPIGDAMLRDSGAELLQSTEAHHKFGRCGELLCDERGLIASSRKWREWPHQNPRKARELGLLGSAENWNVRIDRHRVCEV